MARFDAGTAVESLEYDFTKYGGGSGAVTEPSTGRVQGFFNNMRSMFKEVKSLREGIGGLDPDEMTEDQITEAMDKMEDDNGASNLQTKTIEHLAYLCGADWKYVDIDGHEIVEGTGDGEWVLMGGSPTFKELEALPFRILQAFSSWLVEEIKPKRTTPGTKR